MNNKKMVSDNELLKELKNKQVSIECKCGFKTSFDTLENMSEDEFQKALRSEAKEK